MFETADSGCQYRFQSNWFGQRVYLSLIMNEFRLPRAVLNTFSSTLLATNLRISKHERAIAFARDDVNEYNFRAGWAAPNV